MAALLERLDDPLAVVALHFDHPILDCAARTAGRAQLLAQQGEGERIEREPGDERYALAAATLRLARYAHHAVACRCQSGAGLANAFRDRLPAFGAHPSAIGGIDKAAR